MVRPSPDPGEVRSSTSIPGGSRFGRRERSRSLRRSRTTRMPRLAMTFRSSVVSAQSSSERKRHPALTWRPSAARQPPRSRRLRHPSRSTRRCGNEATMDTHRNRPAQVIKAQKSAAQRSRQKQAASVRDDTSFGKRTYPAHGTGAPANTTCPIWRSPTRARTQ